jgi:hypothetical protein
MAPSVLRGIAMNLTERRGRAMCDAERTHHRLIAMMAELF